MADRNKVLVFLKGRVRLKANEAAVVNLRTKNYNELKENEKICIVPNPIELTMDFRAVRFF